LVLRAVTSRAELAGRHRRLCKVAHEHRFFRTSADRLKSSRRGTLMEPDEVIAHLGFNGEKIVRAGGLVTTCAAPGTGSSPGAFESQYSLHAAKASRCTYRWETRACDDSMHEGSRFGTRRNRLEIWLLKGTRGPAALSKAEAPNSGFAWSRAVSRTPLERKSYLGRAPCTESYSWKRS
jgi:hypothetical protein